MTMALGLGLGLPFAGSSASAALDATTLDIASQSTDLAYTATELTALNTVVVALKAAGILATRDFLYSHAELNTQRQLINWADPLGTKSTQSGAGAVSQIPGLGARMNSSSGYLDAKAKTGGAFKAQQNDTCAGVWFTSAVQDDKVPFGNNTTSINPWSTANKVRVRCNSSTTDATLAANTADSTGLYQVNRTGSASYTVRRNKAAVGTVTAASTTPDATNTMGVCGNPAFATSSSKRVIAVSHSGSSLSTAAQDALYDAFVPYLSFLGATTPNLAVGALTDTSFKVRVMTPIASTVTIYVGTNPNPSVSPAFTSSAVASTTDTTYTGTSQTMFEARQIVAVTGLSANTDYYIGAAEGGVLDLNGVIRVRTAPVTNVRTAYSEAVLSCSEAKPEDYTVVYEKIASLRPLFVSSIGDTPYIDQTYYGVTTSSGIGLHRFAQRDHFRNRGVRAVAATCAFDLVRDDHDTLADDCNRTTTTNFDAKSILNRQGDVEFLPNYPLVQELLGEVDQTKWCRTFTRTIGKNRYIYLDTRTQRENSGSMLGDASALYWNQLDWLISTEIPYCAAQGFDNVFLISPTGVPGQYAGWASQATWAAELTTIVNAVKAQAGMPRTWIDTGDDHNCMIDDGSAGGLGIGLPVFRTSGMYTTSLLTSPAETAPKWRGVATKISTNARAFGYRTFDANGEITFSVYGKDAGFDEITKPSIVVIKGPWSTTDYLPLATVPSTSTASAGGAKTITATLDWLPRVGGGTVDWACPGATPSSGTVTFNPNTRTADIVLSNVGAAGTRTVTISNPDSRCGLGATVACAITVS